jgi:hypothetical protein
MSPQEHKVERRPAAIFAAAAAGHSIRFHGIAAVEVALSVRQSGRRSRRTLDEPRGGPAPITFSPQFGAMLPHRLGFGEAVPLGRSL